MCGIAGHVASADAGRSPREAHALVRAMADALHHRGPDASGVHRSGLGDAGPHAPVDHRPVDGRQPADARAPTGRWCWCSTARSTTSASWPRSCATRACRCARVRTPRCCCELYRLHGLSFVEQAARHVRVRDLGRAPAAAGAGARSPGQEAALLPHRQARAVVRVRAAGAARRRRHRARAPIAQAMHAYLALGYVPSDVRRHRGRAQAARPARIAVFEDGKLARGALLEAALRAAAAVGGGLRRGAAPPPVRGGEDAPGVGRAAGRVPFGRHRFVGGRRDHEQGRREAGQDVLDRLRREGLLRGRATRARWRASTRPSTTRRCCARTPPSCCPSWCTPTASRSPIRRRCRRTCCRR